MSLQILTSASYDAFDKEIQAEIIKQLQDDSKVVQSMIIGDIIELNERTRNIRYGLYKRSEQEPATSYDWTDPKEADGVPIFARLKASETDPNNKLHTPFDRAIMNNKASYLAGKPMEFTVKLDNESQKTMQEQLLDQLAKNNNFAMLNTGLVESATRCGAGYALLYKPVGSNDVKIRQVNDWECIVIHDEATGEPAYAMRYYPEVELQTASTGEAIQTTQWYVEWYDGVNMTVYKGTGSTYSMVEEPTPHLLGTIDKPFIPLVEFRNNRERVGDVSRVIPLMDAYDTADSNLSSDIDKFANAFLHVTGAGFDLDDEGIEQMKRTFIIATDDNGKAEYITRQIDIDGIEKFKDGLERRIYKYASSYDPDSLGSDGAKTAYEIAQKLKPLEDASKNTELQFKEAWFYVLEGVNNYYSKASREVIDLENLDINFQRNIPRNVMQDLKDLLAAGGVLSQENIIKLSPFEVDVLANLEQLEKEHEMRTVSLTEVTEM
jgi:SPP1 family phage portal protein